MRVCALDSFANLCRLRSRKLSPSDNNQPNEHGEKLLFVLLQLVVIVVALAPELVLWLFLSFVVEAQARVSYRQRVGAVEVAVGARSARWWKFANNNKHVGLDLRAIARADLAGGCNLLLLFAAQITSKSAQMVSTHNDDEVTLVSMLLAVPFRYSPARLSSCVGALVPSWSCGRSF